jgi:uncharacterized membrane protein YeaQ/YmgE (transglycosylase-associated protein family)
MFGLIWWLLGYALIGLAAGWAARKVVPGVRSGGPAVDCLTGMVGAVIGGVIAWFLPIPSFFGLLPAFLGAVLLLIILKATAKSGVRY